MQAVKLVLCGVFALFTLSRLALLFMGTSQLPNGASPGNGSGGSGQLILNLLLIIVLGAVTVWLWKSAMTRQPPRS
ncbi:MAG TPA: hypothetical protein VF600_14780 [Abditibacteriaceae bacterium]|jgi:hypothetical protein